MLNNNQQCLQCGKDDYLVVDSEVVASDDRLKSYTCLCSNCQDAIEIIVVRGINIIYKIEDLYVY